MKFETFPSLAILSSSSEKKSLLIWCSMYFTEVGLFSSLVNMSSHASYAEVLGSLSDYIVSLAISILQAWSWLRLQCRRCRRICRVRRGRGSRARTRLGSIAALGWGIAVAKNTTIAALGFCISQRLTQTTLAAASAKTKNKGFLHWTGLRHQAIKSNFECVGRIYSFIQR